MNKKELAKLIIKIINDKDVKDLKGYEWDSLAHLNIYFELQKVFKKKIPMERAANAKSVSDWVSLLNKKL